MTVRIQYLENSLSSFMHCLTVSDILYSIQHSAYWEKEE